MWSGVSRAALLALVVVVLAGPLARAQDEEPEARGDGFTFDDEEGAAGGVLTFDGADSTPGGVLSFDDDEEGSSCLRGPLGPEELARDLRALVARKRAARAPDAEWYAASLLPVPTSPTPRALLAALDAERARAARGSAHHEGPGGRTARYLGFTAAVCRHGRRAPALLALLQALRPHPWLADARRLVLGRPALDALAEGWARLGAPDPLAPRVQAWVQGERRLPWRTEERRGGGARGVLTFDDEEDDTHLATGTLVTGADGGAYLVDASLWRWQLVADAESSPTPFTGVRSPNDPWDLLAAALRARRRGDEAGALRGLAAAVAASRFDGPGLVREALHRAARNVRVALVDDLARGAAAADVVRRLRELDALDPAGPEPTGLAARLAGLDDADPAPWTRPDWPELGVEARLERLTAALTAVHGVVPARQASSGGCFVFEDCEAKDEEVVPAPLRPLIDRWAEVGWDGVAALVALLADPRPTRLVELGRREPWTVGEVAARLFVRLTGADLDDYGDPEARAAFGATFWGQHGERGPRAYYLGRLECQASPDPSDVGLLIFLRAQPTLATAWIESRLAASPGEDVIAWAELYVRAGAPLTAALEAGLRGALLGDDLDVARAVAESLASDPRFAAERQALCWRLALAGDTRASLALLRTLPRPPSALVLAVAEALDTGDLEELPPGSATDLVSARRLAHPRALRDLVLAAQLASPEVQADPHLLLYAVDTLRRAQEERPTLEGLVALADALDDLGPRLTPALLDQASRLGPWLHRAYAARAAAGDAAAAAACDAIGAWWAGAATRVAGIDRGPCLPAPLVEPLLTTLDVETLAAALGALEERGRLRAQLLVVAGTGRGGLQLRVELAPRPDDHAVGWWTLLADVVGPAGELLSTTVACTGEPTERWARSTLADTLAALRATPGARLVLRATPP